MNMFCDCDASKQATFYITKLRRQSMEINVDNFEGICEDCAAEAAINGAELKEITSRIHHSNQKSKEERELTFGSLKKKVQSIESKIIQMQRISQANSVQYLLDLDTQKQQFYSMHKKLQELLLQEFTKVERLFEEVKQEEVQKLNMFHQTTNIFLKQVKEVIGDIAKKETTLFSIDRDFFDQVTYNCYENLSSIENECAGVSYPELKIITLETLKDHETIVHSLMDKLFKVKFKSYQFDCFKEGSPRVNFGTTEDTANQLLNMKTTFEKIVIGKDFKRQTENTKNSPKSSKNTDFSFANMDLPKEEAETQKMPKVNLQLQQLEPIKPEIRHTQSCVNKLNSIRLRNETDDADEGLNKYQFFFKKFNLKTDTNSPKNFPFELKQNTMYTDRMSPKKSQRPIVIINEEGPSATSQKRKSNEKSSRIQLSAGTPKANHMFLKEKSSGSDQKSDKKALVAEPNMDGCFYVKNSGDWSVMETPEIKK